MQTTRQQLISMLENSPMSIKELSRSLRIKEKEIYRAQALETGKPENIVDKIAEGKLKKFFDENCLLKQPYVRDPNISVEDLLNEVIAKIGENISIKRFARYQIGES